MARAPQATSSKRPVNKTGQLSKVNKLSGYKEKWGIDVEPTNELIY